MSNTLFYLAMVLGLIVVFGMPYYQGKIAQAVCDVNETCRLQSAQAEAAKEYARFVDWNKDEAKLCKDALNMRLNDTYKINNCQIIKCSNATETRIINLCSPKADTSGAFTGGLVGGMIGSMLWSD